MWDVFDSISNKFTTERFGSVDSFLNLLMNLAIGSGIAGGVIFFAMAGIKFMSSGGDPKAMDSAKRSLQYSLIGFILSISALTIRTLIENILIP